MSRCEEFDSQFKHQPVLSWPHTFGQLSTLQFADPYLSEPFLIRAKYEDAIYCCVQRKVLGEGRS